MPSCKKTIKVADKDGNSVALVCKDSEGHEGRHQASLKNLATGYFVTIWFG